MSSGSGLLSSSRAQHPHLVDKPGGISGEVWDLRRDVQKALTSLAAIAVEEWTNVVGAAAPGAAALLDAAASVAAPVTVLKAAMKAAGLAQLALCPRPLTITTAGSTAADAPATALITGKNAAGAVQTETLTVAQTATIATTTKIWSDITSVVYPAADGTGATMSIGIGSAQLKAATATVASVVTLTAADLQQYCISADAPRALVFTTAGGTAADAPATAAIVGYDAHGNRQTETVTLAQTATTATTARFYSRIESITYPAADGTGATIAIGIGTAVGLHSKIKTRAGLAGLVREIAGGSLVTNGTVAAPGTTDLPNGSYTPNAGFDGVLDCAIYYDSDAAA
jgi:hypothetical protein